MDNKGAEIIYLNRKKKIKHWIAVLIFLILVLFAVKLRIKNITVKGIKTYTEQEAIDTVFASEKDYNTVYCLIKSITKNKRELPFIADYDIRLTGPTSCELIIYEKNPVGCVRFMSSYMYFDSDGMVIENSEEKIEGIPVIEGVRFGYIVIGQKLPVESQGIFLDIMNVTQQIKLFGIGCESIKFDDTEAITVTAEGGDIDVRLGTNENISVKISAMKDMLPEIRAKGLKGTLDLSNYDDSSGNAVSLRVREE